MTTLMAMFSLIRRRFPERLMPKSLKDLLRLNTNHGTNGPRMFWKWLDRQPWRKMMPYPHEASVVMVDYSLPDPYFIAKHPMFLPSEVFASIYAYDQELFKRRFLGEEGALMDYWNRNRDQDFFRQHPVLSRPDTDLTKVVPLVIHADDAESHRRRSFCISTLASALVGGCSPWDSRMLLYVTDNQHCVDATWDTLDAWVVWSLTELSVGSWLSTDPWGNPMTRRQSKAGTPLAGGYRAILVCHKGDQKYIQRAYHMTGSWVSECICWYCRATRTGANCYTLHGKHAPHRATRADTQQFISSYCRNNPWVQLPGWHIDILYEDWLHVTDLTLVPDAAASALVELCETDLVWQGENIDDRLRASHVQFSQECRAHKIRNKGQVFSLKVWSSQNGLWEFAWQWLRKTQVMNMRGFVQLFLSTWLA